MQTEPQFSQLPTDVFYIILQYLDIRSIFSVLPQVSRSLYEITTSKSFLLPLINIFRVTSTHDFYEIHQLTEGEAEYPESENDLKVLEASIHKNAFRSVMTHETIEKLIAKMNKSLLVAKEGYKLRNQEDTLPMEPKEGLEFPTINYLYILKRRYLMYRYWKRRTLHVIGSEPDCSPAYNFSPIDSNYNKYPTNPISTIRWSRDSGDFLDSFISYFDEYKKYEELNIGRWTSDFMVHNPAQPIIDLIVEHFYELDHLKSISFADMSYQDCEVSWLRLGNFDKIFEMFPKLMFWKSKGSQNLQISPLQNSHLLSITLVTGSLHVDVFENLLKSQLPNLYHLELWVGTEEYGMNIPLQMIEQLFSRDERGHFPTLEYLGFRNYQGLNDICELIVKSAIISRIRILDLSLGDLEPDGAQHLLGLKDRKDLMLEVLDIHYNGLSKDKDLMNELAELPMIVNMTNSLQDRYIALGE